MSTECEHLLSNMLVEASRRYNMCDVIEHKWVKHPLATLEYEAMRAQVREFAGEYFTRSLERRRKRDASAAAQAVQPLVDDLRPASPNRTRQTPLSTNSVVLDYMSTSLKFDRNVVLDVRDAYFHLLHAYTSSFPLCCSSAVCH